MSTGQFIPLKRTGTTLPSFAPVRNGLLQRKCACGGTPGPTGECEESRKKKLQRKIGNRQSSIENDCSVPPVVHEVLRSPGQPLDPATRTFMEPRFGHDFSQVRIHTDAQAAESAQAVNALAYAVGTDLIFGAGQYVPAATEGKRLLAHELAHVVQQSGESAKESCESRRLSGSSSPSSHEQAANRITEGMLAGTAVDMVREEAGNQASRLQRQETRTGPAAKTWYTLKVPPAVRQPGMTC